MKPEDRNSLGHDGSIIAQYVTQPEWICGLVRSYWEGWRTALERKSYEHCHSGHRAIVAILETYERLWVNMVPMGWGHVENNGQIQLTAPNGRSQIAICSGKNRGNCTVINPKGNLTFQQIKEGNKRFGIQPSLFGDEVECEGNPVEEIKAFPDFAHIWVVGEMIKKSEDLAIDLVLPYDLLDGRERFVNRDWKRVFKQNLHEEFDESRIEWVGTSIEPVITPDPVERPNRVEVMPVLEELPEEILDDEELDQEERAG